MNRIFLVHGFNVKDAGRGTVERLKPYLGNQELVPIGFSYGWLGLMGVYFLNPKSIRQLVAQARKGDVAVAHSNGCVVAHKAALLGAPFQSMVLINPALRSDARIADNVKTLVLHNDGDHAVKFGALLRRLLPWAPLGDPDWGDMGAKGHAPQHYVPKGLISRAFFRINTVFDQQPWALRLSRLASAPLGIIYCLLLGPMEVLVTLLRNNLLSKDRQSKLTFDNSEDKRLLVFGMVLPLTFWSIIGCSVTLTL